MSRHTDTHTHAQKRFWIALLWMSICSLDFVTTVVLGVVVMLVTGDSFEACIFSNNLHETHTKVEIGEQSEGNFDDQQVAEQQEVWRRLDDCNTHRRNARTLNN